MPPAQLERYNRVFHDVDGERWRRIMGEEEFVFGSSLRYVG